MRAVKKPRAKIWGEQVLTKRMCRAQAAVLGLLLLLTGCTKEETSSSEAPLTEEQILQQKIDANFEINDEDFTLVQFEEPMPGDDIAVIETSRGIIKVWLFPNEAAEAVKSFQELAKAGAYDNQPFSQIKNNYLLQSGGSTGTTAFENEYTLNLWNFRGAVGMVNSIGGTTGSQFYIIQNNGLTREMLDEMEQGGFPESVREKYNRFGGAPWMDGKYTVFGQVIEGMTVVDDIALTGAEQQAAASGASSSGAPAEAQELKIIKVTLEKYPAPSSSSSASAG